MRTLYLMRHGETFFNRRGIVQGWCDSPLTERGRVQAERVRDWLEARGADFDAVYSSPSERAWDTAEIAVRGTVECRRERGLKEFHYGVLEGGSYELLLPGPYAPYGDFLVPFGGEAEADVAARMRDTLADVMARPGHERVLAVSHGACTRAFAALVCGPSPDGMSPRPGIEAVAANCSVYVYGFDGARFSLLELFEPDDAGTRP